MHCGANPRFGLALPGFARKNKCFFWFPFRFCLAFLSLWVVYLFGFLGLGNSK